MSELPDMQELVCIFSTDSMPMMYVEVDAARRLLDIAKQQQAEIERLTAQLERGKAHAQERVQLASDLTECRRLLREAVESGGSLPAKWFREAAEAGGE